MLFRRKLSLWIIFLVCLLSSISACKIEEVFEKTENSDYLVRVLFTNDGLGDFSYCDDILRGILQEQQHSNFRLHYTMPVNIEQAEVVIKEWHKDNDPKYRYNIMAASYYEPLALATRPDTQQGNSLMFETTSSDLNIAAFRFCGYGVSFLVGIAAYSKTNAEKAAYMGGRQGEYFIEECYDGFREGYIYAGGKEVNACYISESVAGFAMPLKAYQMADSLYKLYPFIYVMAGGSNSGVYKYLREHPEVDGYTAGVDVDQSAHSVRIIGSMIKSIGNSVQNYVRKWMEGAPITSYYKYDLRSKNISFKVSEGYTEELGQTVSEHFDIAIKKELEYYEKSK